MGTLLKTLLANISAQPPEGLLQSDPLPTVRFDKQAKPKAINISMQNLLSCRDDLSLQDLLPVNYVQLIASCLKQERVIAEVESKLDERYFLWQFFPEPSMGSVIVRCRDATQEILNKREAETASRLYRLITENTTDLISRHRPDGGFWMLRLPLGLYWDIGLKSYVACKLERWSTLATEICSFCKWLNPWSEMAT